MNTLHSYHIRYLKRQDIDPVKWDDCIDRASNGMVYAYSFYLDNMARHWSGLVWNDYEAVMPLTWNQKWGIKYLYQPPLTQQLGIFFREWLPIQGTPPVEPTDANNQSTPPAGLIDAFLDEAGRRFRFAEIFLNYKNPVGQTGGTTATSATSIPDTTIERRMNYILSLAIPYPDLRDRYSQALIKNLAVADGFLLHYSNIFDPAAAISLYYETYRERLSHVKKEDYDRFLQVCRHLQKEGGLLVRAVYEDETRQQLLATTLLLKKKDLIYLILPTTLAEGKTRQANHFLLDQLIREFAGQELTLDFEGSDIPGIARFYKKFGPAEQPYFFYRFNRLPWPLRLFKKRN
jgi:hypothetical protein